MHGISSLVLRQVDLATQAVEDAVRQSLYFPNVAQSWPLVIGKQLLTIFEHRGDVTNGKFYAVASVPLVERRQKEVVPADTESFLNDVGILGRRRCMGFPRLSCAKLIYQRRPWRMLCGSLYTSQMLRKVGRWLLANNC